PALEATRPGWEANLKRLFEKMHFILGEQVTALESELAAAFDAGFAIGVGNGTDAIGLALREAGVSGEVLTTSLTAPFTGIGILSAGCRPRFADVDPVTLQMDPDDAGNRWKKKTAGMVCVHLYGQPCQLDRMLKLARGAGKPLIQDACQAHGATFGGKALTSFSPHVAYSFYPTKNLGCLGDGGAIMTRNRKVADRLRMLRDGGRKGGQVTYLPGINSRLDEMQACYLRAFLPHLKDWNEQRRQIASRYDEVLAGCRGVRPVVRTGESVCHLYVIRAARRDRLRQYLAERGIGTGIHYPVPMHLHPTFADCGLKRGDLPHAEKACREIVSLPVWPGLTLDQAEQVAGRVREFYA
ncbi:MAG: DegT/DnrJ/EryC1/StrS family aminotransferase, partial [Bryobacteraceae bacterium]|nr:DegT/DnrJ/EryC1/StrS family aminotransferase [Bryobacteraceae bacterium]